MFTLTTLVIVWSVVSVWSYLLSKHEVEEVYDATLAQTAKLLLTLVRHEMEKEQVQFARIDQLLLPEHKYEAKLSYIIHYPDGTLAMRAPNAPEFPWRFPMPGYMDLTIDGDQWRVFSLIDPLTGVIVQTAHHHEVRDEMVAYLTGGILPVFMLSLLLITFFVWYSIGEGLSPLVSVTASIANQRPGHLSPVNENGVPKEIRPLVSALNHLLARLDYALELEHRFTADAAHELRTPLAGLKTQAQVALRATDSRQRQQALEQIAVGIDRNTRLVSQMLTLTRVDAGKSADWGDVDLFQICADVVAGLGDMASGKGIEIGLEGQQVVIAGDAGLIHVLVSNLVNNAIQYVPQYGQILVAVRRFNGTAEITVKDNGPGIPAELREQIFERFKRGDHQTILGSGLGLSIVKRVAEVHGASVSLGEGLADAGLGVRVRFGEPALYDRLPDCGDRETLCLRESSGRRAG